MRYHCLVIDDEIDLAQATCEYFNTFGINTTYVSNSRECMEFLENNHVSLILLDINLENESGFTLCKKIREQLDIPILFISARQSDDDILIALNIGGDDYIKKPYSLSVLLAKVKVVLKRQEKTKESEDVTCGSITVDIDARKVYVDGREVILKNKEFNLFIYLFHNRNKVVSKEELFSNIWGDEYYSDGTLNVHIRKIREQIERNPNEPKFIKTVWGIGYIFEI